MPLRGFLEDWATEREMGVGARALGLEGTRAVSAGFGAGDEWRMGRWLMSCVFIRAIG